MAAATIDAYLAEVDEPKRTTLQTLRNTIKRLRPDAEECISYGMPAFRVGGHVVAGFAAFTHHLSYLPHSGAVLAELAHDLTGYTMTPGSLHFAADTPLPEHLVAKLLAARIRMAEDRQPRR